MTRDQLEARAWQRAQNLVSTSPQERCDAMDGLLADCDAYTATALGEIDHARRPARNGREYAAARTATITTSPRRTT